MGNKLTLNRYNGIIVLVRTSQRGMYQREVDVDMLNAVKIKLADVVHLIALTKG